MSTNLGAVDKKKVQQQINQIHQEGRLIVVSGYFDPVHIGHLRLFQKAKKLGGRLVVIVNNDSQMKLKGKPLMMKDKDRAEIIQAFEVVDYAIVAVDQDRTVCQTLELLKPDIFANGGDRRNLDDIPESEVCRKNSIKMVFGIGGEKIRSSSDYIRKVQKEKFGS